MCEYIRRVKTMHCCDLTRVQHNEIMPVIKYDPVFLWLFTISVSDFHPPTAVKKTFPVMAGAGHALLPSCTSHPQLG